MEFIGSKTESNLWEAFAGESQARNKYSYYAERARADGYVQIADIFFKTAENEREHARLWLKFLDGIGDTAANLKAAAAGENFEWSDMYARMEQQAREEGFADIAAVFAGVAEIEKAHEQRYNTLLKNLEDGKVFVKENNVVWVCANCGHIHTGTAAPQQCPVCRHPQGFFHLQANNY